MEYVGIKHISNDEIDTFVEDCNLFAIFDAPVNVLFSQNFVNNILSYKDIFSHFAMSNNIFFSCKANKCLAFLKIASDNGCGIDVSSIYELNDALKYTNKIIASGPAKTEEYIQKSIDNNAIISVDDIVELKKIVSQNKKCNVLLRISDIDGIISRFGINKNQLDECLNMISNSKLNLLGFSFHINNYDLGDRIRAINEIIDIVKKRNLSIKYIDIGGGLPVNYCDKSAYFKFLQNNNKNMYFRKREFNDFYPYYNDIEGKDALEYILKNVKDSLGNIEIIIESGRSLLNNSGISIYEVSYLKQLYNGDFIIVTNGNINGLSEQWFNTDYLVEPLLYKANRNAKVLRKPIYASIAGNLCLEQDMITWRKIKFDYLPEPGDYLIYYNTAGYQMDSNESEFHKLPLINKYIVEKDGCKYIIRKDEEYDCK